MSSPQIILHKALNGQPSLQARAFAVAFLPRTQPNRDTLAAWSARATEALAAIVEIRSAIHRWRATGIPDGELAAAFAVLEAAGLAGFVDELIGLAMEGER